MFEKLFDFILNFLEFFRCAVIRNQYEDGLVLRMGKYHRDLKLGFNFLLPFYLERFRLVNIVTKTDNIGSQSLYSKDEVGVLVSVFIRYKIRNVKRWILEAENPAEVLGDVTYGVIGEHVLAKTWEEINRPQFHTDIFTTLKGIASRDLGVSLEGIQFCDLTRSKTFRILNT